MKFDQKYNRDGFAVFLRDFLPEDYVEKEKDIADLSRAKIIMSARELGYSPSLGVHVLEMTHAKEADPRVSIATDAFKILATFGYDRALVIFNNDDSENYRFSYLTISLDLNEKNKVVAKYSNARRYSFYLGEDAKIKTPEQQLIKRGRVKDAEDLLSRFSLEVVNKQFYLEIASYFDELVDEQVAHLALPFQSDANVRKNFAMRLIGRLVFCWFLKQKKSKDGALVPNELLSASAVKGDYYHTILEPLFFEILNTQIDERDIRNDVYDKVPYLNGGLFSPQHDDYYELDRATFTSRHINTLRIADTWFRDFFALLETYNFTIDENTVFDQELSVDPEMLGRIFENLLAEINPDTGSSERKRTGSYYTPRQVVEYMVDRSLVEYLKTATRIEEKRLLALVSIDFSDDEGNQLNAEENAKVVEAVEKLKILDPACGSGAFPIGALQKIVWILQRVDPQCDLWLDRKLQEVPELYRKKINDYFRSNPPDYIRKLDVIKNSIFGVDIQPIAVEMSRLRCFLTLVVELEIDDGKKNRGIEPLPNLDFKFVCANTLVGLPKKASNGLFEDHSGIEELSVIMSEYFSASRAERELIKNRFYNKQKELLNRMIMIGAVGDLTLMLTNWSPFENKPTAWFDPEWMFGIDGGFDVVLGNPPYIKEYTNRKAFDGLRENLCYQGKMDIWYLFACFGIDVLRQGGVVSFIAQNNWVTSSGASKMRNKVINETQIISLVDFGSYKIFETAGIQTMVMIFKKDQYKERYSIDYRRLLGDKLSFLDVSDLLTQRKNKHAEYLSPEIVRSKMLDKKITFSNPGLNHLLDKMERLKNFSFDPEAEVAQGIVYPQDKLNKKNQARLGDGYSVGDGIFVLSNEEVQMLGLTEKERELIRPVYTTNELKKWFGIQKNKEWVIYTGSAFKSEDKIKDYPGIKKHLDRFRDVITSSNKPYGLHRARIEDFFKGEKIVVTRKCAEPTFTYTDFESYVSATFYVIKTSRINQKYLIGLLNSRLFSKWLRNRGKMQGANCQIDKEPILELPILVGSKERQHEIASLVERIIEAKKNSPKADVSKIENELDEKVFDLYHLTSEERALARSV